MSSADETVEATADGVIRILERDEWTCQVCGYEVTEGSNERMFATLVGSDPTNPDDVEARCRSCHEMFIEDNLSKDNLVHHYSASRVENSHSSTDTPVDILDIFDRDNWTCKVCGYTPPEGSEKPMYATFFASDKTNPKHYQTRCREHHVDYVSDDPDPEFAPPNSDNDADDDPEPETQTESANDTDHLENFTRQFWAMPFFLTGTFAGVYLIVGGLSILNPLRMVGMSTWPVAVYTDIDTITLSLYFSQIVFDAPPPLIVGAISLVVGTQIAIWYEPKNGLVTRLTRWTIGKVKVGLERISNAW